MSHISPKNFPTISSRASEILIFQPNSVVMEVIISMIGQYEKFAQSWKMNRPSPASGVEGGECSLHTQERTTLLCIQFWWDVSRKREAVEMCIV